MRAPADDRRPPQRTVGRRAAVPTSTVEAPALDGVTLDADSAGVRVLVGCDAQDSAVALTLVRATPTRIVVVGGSYLARQLVVRAAAVGVTVVVATGRPMVWESVVRATERPGRPGLTVVHDWAPGSFPTPTSEEPVLVVHDGSALPHHVTASPTAWQSTVVLLPFLHPEVGETATGPDLALVRRLPPEQARLASRLWELDDDRAAELTELPDDGVVALRRGLWKAARLMTTPLEAAVLGPMRAGD